MKQLASDKDYVRIDLDHTVQNKNYEGTWKERVEHSFNYRSINYHRYGGNIFAMAINRDTETLFIQRDKEYKGNPGVALSFPIDRFDKDMIAWRLLSMSPDHATLKAIRKKVEYDRSYKKKDTTNVWREFRYFSKHGDIERILYVYDQQIVINSHSNWNDDKIFLKNIKA